MTVKKLLTVIFREVEIYRIEYGCDGKPEINILYEGKRGDVPERLQNCRVSSIVPLIKNEEGYLGICVV